MTANIKLIRKSCPILGIACSVCFFVEQRMQTIEVAAALTKKSTTCSLYRCAGEFVYDYIAQCSAVALHGLLRCLAQVVCNKRGTYISHI